jgi:hypothetical protein
MILGDNEMSFIAAALEAAAEKYPEDAAANLRRLNPNRSRISRICRPLIFFI